MKKIVFILICFSAALIISCGDSGSSEKCESSFDCPIGKVCSNGMCVSEGSADDGSGDGSNGEIPDEGNGGGSNGGGSGNHDGGDTAPDDDSDSATDPEDITGTCEPGKTQKCGYQGPAGTEDVGPCKAATRTCKEDGTWGKCEGAVEPVYESGEELCTNGIDDDCDGKVDNGTEEGGCAYWNNTEVPDADADADVDPGIIDVGYTGDYDDAYQLPVDVEICNDSCIPMKADCFPSDINEGESGLCNQVDDDCDGIVDEGCSCTAGQTQACFLGPKNYRNTGTCQDGVQTCKVTMRAGSTGVWGECVGGISPSLDKCDNADNNCNGCTDDKLCCAPPIDCAYDIGTATPFEDKLIDGTQIYDTGHKFNDADTATWEWTLTKGPCDIVLGKTSFTTKGATTAAGLDGNGTKSTVVSGVGLSHFKVNFILSGSYILHLKVTRPNGEVHECEWKLRVVSDGLRIELCWDTNKTVDVDLHLGMNGKTTQWASDDCYYGNCKNTGTPNWGYPDTTNTILTNASDPDNLVFTKNKKAYNPRLDIDNIRRGAIPENINIDNPNNEDTFKVGVRHYQSGTSNTHPVVNVYCGGTIKATYGGYVSDTGDSFVYQVNNFNSEDDFWKVVEIKWVDDGRGFKSDACELTPKWDNGYVVEDNLPLDYSPYYSYSNW
jgi:hypothetical protein